VNILSKKVELQEKDKRVKRAILRIDNDRKIKYNYLQLIVTKELRQIYKTLKSL